MAGRAKASGRGTRTLIAFRLMFLIVRLAQLGLRLLPLLIRPREDRIDRFAMLLRVLLESMGFTYIKFGQFLAFRFDLLPRIVCDELNRLFDNVEALPFELVRDIVEEELGTPLDACFASFEPSPLAAASLAQVHRAVAIDGRALAVKVQRPTARADFEADMRIGRTLARLVDRLELLGTLSAVAFLAEFEDFTRRETDFLVEGAVAERLRTLRAEGEHIPAIHWDLTTTHVLAEEYIDGIRLTDFLRGEEGRDASEEAASADRAAGVDRDRVIDTIVRACFTHALEDGLFHADPHPGNMLVRPDGSVGFVDFGLFGQLTPEQRRHCIGYLHGLALGDFESSFHHYYRLLVPTWRSNRAAFKREMIRMMHDWAAASARGSGTLARRHLGALMLRTATLLRQHHIRMDTDLLLFWRLLYVLDSLALRLDPCIDVVALIRDFFASGHGRVPRPPKQRAGQADLPAKLAQLVSNSRASRPIRLLRGSGRDSTARRSAAARTRLIALGIVAVGLAGLIDAI